MDFIFAGGKFRAKSKFANIAKISSTRKIGVIQYLDINSNGSLLLRFVLSTVTLNERCRLYRVAAFVCLGRADDASATTYARYLSSISPSRLLPVVTSLFFRVAPIDLSHTRGAPPSNARENEDVWDTSAWQHR